GRELSLSDEFVPVSKSLIALSAKGPAPSPQKADELYRRALTYIQTRLMATRRELLEKGAGAQPYDSAQQFAEHLTIIANSLAENGSPDIAEGRVAELRDAVQSFGFHLAVMDLRQNSTVHERAVAELLREAGVHESYGSVPEAEKIALLVRELTSTRMLRTPYRKYSDETARELDIASTAASLRSRFGPGTVTNY